MLGRNTFDDLIVLLGLEADLRGLESEFVHVPPTEDLGQDGCRLTNEHVETSLIRSLLKLVVQVMERFDKEPPHVDRESVAVACVEPRIYDEDGFEPQSTGDGIVESRVVM